LKLLLDENLAPRLSAALGDLYPGSSHLSECGLRGATDDAVWQFAKGNGYVIASKDSDFSQRSVLEGCPPKVIWLRIGNGTTSRMEFVLRNAHSQIATFVRNPEPCCLVLSVPVKGIR